MMKKKQKADGIITITESCRKETFGIFLHKLKNVVIIHQRPLQRPTFEGDLSVCLRHAFDVPSSKHH